MWTTPLKHKTCFKHRNTIYPDTLPQNILSPTSRKHLTKIWSPRFCFRMPCQCCFELKSPVSWVTVCRTGSAKLAHVPSHLWHSAVSLKCDTGSPRLLWSSLICLLGHLFASVSVWTFFLFLLLPRLSWFMLRLSFLYICLWVFSLEL